MSSRANLHLSYKPAGRSHCRLQKYHGYIKHHHRGMGGSPDDLGEVSHSPILTSLHLRHSSFPNPSAALPRSQLILQPFRCFTYVIGISPMLQLILQPFRRFTYVTLHSTALPFLHLRHRHFTYVTAHSPNTSAALPTSQVILQPFRCFTYVTGTSCTSPG